MKKNQLKKFFLPCLLAAGFLLLTDVASAQQKVEGGELEKLILVSMPQSYTAPKGKVEGVGSARVSKGDRKWLVYSDREDNKTYFDKNCTREKMKLGFLEGCVVAQETEDAVRLVRFDPSNAPFEDKLGSKKNELIFRKGAESEEVGWIKKKNLLLWSYAMVNDSTNYTIKAVSVKRLESKDDIASLIKRGILDLYNIPKEDKNFDTKKDINLFQYLFVYKKEGDMYLLGKGNKVGASSISDDILGWAPYKQIHIWDNAICLRVNFDPDAVQERKDKNIDVKFFKDLTEAKNFRDKGVGKELPFYFDPSKTDGNDNPYLLGFPIIENLTEKGIYKTGYVTNTVSASGANIFSVRKQAVLNSKFEAIKQDKQNVNMVFVVDGSMRPSFKTLASAISSISYIEGGEEITRFKYKLGAIVFNDSKCEEDAFKTIPLISSKDNFIDKLNIESNRTSPCAVNRDVNGAPLYSAIKKACDMFEGSTTTNIIIVIGGTTDTDKSIKTAALQALVNKEAKMSFIQIINKEGDLYDGFIRDCRYFLKNSADELDKKYFASEIASGKVKAARLMAADNYAYLENSISSGSFNWKDIGQTYQPAEIKKTIQKLVDQNERKMNDLLSRWDVQTKGAEKGVNETDEESTKQFMALLGEANISQSDIELLANNQNFQLFIAAFAPVTTAKLDKPLLTRTLFMSRREFDRLADTFERLNNSYSTSAVREDVVNTYKNIIVSYKGGNENLEEIGNKYSIDDFLKLVTGLTFATNNPLFRKNIVDLSNPKKTTQEEIERLKTSFNAIYKKLTTIRKNKLFKIEQEEDDFFWVPENTFQVNT